MKKTLVLAYSKQAGGAEKSAIKLFNGFTTIENTGAMFGTLVRSSKDFYQISDSSKTIDFLPLCNMFIARKIPFRWLWLPILAPFDLMHFRLKIKSHRIDSVVSFGAGVGCVTFLALLGLNVRQVTSERIDPDPEVYKPSILARLMRPYIYRHGVLCSVQTIGFLHWVQHNWGVKAFVTPNHFEIPTNQWANLSVDGPVVAVGRPAFQKGYDLLFSAWKHVEEFDSRELWIVCDDGEGYIQSLILQSGCQNIRVKPLTNDLESLFNKASIFVSTARFEGYPNAIAEAIIYGIPVMTTISSDIVSDWSDAQMCVAIKDTTPEVMSAQILSVLQDPELLKKISDNGVMNRKLFDWESVKHSWLRLLS